MKFRQRIAQILLFACTLEVLISVLPRRGLAHSQNSSRDQAQGSSQRNSPNQGSNPRQPSQPSKRSPSRPNRPGRPAQANPPKRPGPSAGPNRPSLGAPNRGRPAYAFRPQDRDRIRRYYARNLGYINRARRPRFVIGTYIPVGYRGYFRPVPAPLLGYLPPPPPGYAIGYFDGYCVVYDPITFAILNLVDLLD